MSDREPKPQNSVARIAVWIIVSAAGLYMLGSGIIGILAD